MGLLPDVSLILSLRLQPERRDTRYTHRRTSHVDLTIDESRVSSHHINVLSIYIVLSKQDWIPLAAKVRLLEWKIRMDLLQYAARSCPKLSLDKINSYSPKQPESDPNRGKSITNLAGEPDLYFFYSKPPIPFPSAVQ